MSFWRRLIETIAPPKYPDYAEYRDEDSAPQSGGATDASGATDAELAKLRKIKIVGGLALLLSIAVAGYLYASGGLLATKERPDLKQVLTPEIVRSIGEDEEGESLEDVKRWAREMEASVARQATRDTIPAAPRREIPPTIDYEPYMGPLYTETNPIAVEPAPVRPREPVSAPIETRPPAPPPPPPPRQAPTETQPGRYQPKRYEPVIIEPREIEPY